MEYLIRVKSNHDCWIAEWNGDPGRTLIRENARVYPNKDHAESQIKHLKKEYPNRAFSIEEN